MKIYDGENIRNVALVGHGDTGKTQLVSALLFTAGMVNRLGKVDEGTSVTDYDEEEIQRKFSISASLAYAEWGKDENQFRRYARLQHLHARNRGGPDGGGFRPVAGARRGRHRSADGERSGASAKSTACRASW